MKWRNWNLIFRIFSPKVESRLGAFVLKDEAVDTITSGSLFLKRKEKTERLPSVKSTAAELKEASKNAEMRTFQTASAKRDLKNIETVRTLNVYFLYLLFAVCYC